MNIDAVIVEVAKLDLSWNDALLLKPTRKLTPEEFQNLNRFADQISQQLRVRCVVGDCDLEFTVLSKDGSLPSAIAQLQGDEEHCA